MREMREPDGRSRMGSSEDSWRAPIIRTANLPSHWIPASNVPRKDATDASLNEGPAKEDLLQLHELSSMHLRPMG